MTSPGSSPPVHKAQIAARVVRFPPKALPYKRRPHCDTAGMTAQSSPGRSTGARIVETGRATIMSGTNWNLSGEYMESCNCDYLCPCIFTNPQAEVTYDHCIAALIFRIDQGQSGAVNLDGLCFALVIRSGKVMADGNWVFACVVDERADDAQRTALSAIVSGEAGGTPGMIRSNLVSDFRGVEFKPIEFRMAGLKRGVTIPEILSFEIEGVASRNRSGEPFFIDNTAHPANRRLALARASALHMQGFGLGLDMVGRGNNGHFAPFNWAA
jgi:hypothetical protein